MKLGLLGGYGGKMIQVDIDRIKYAESLGYDSIWTAEAYGADAVTLRRGFWHKPIRSRSVPRLCRCLLGRLPVLR